MHFMSDTSAPAHPAILEAMVQANDGVAPSYGADNWSDQAKRALEDVFETELDVWFAPSGTAANALAISTFCSPLSSIVCHEEAHIERDERSACEFFTGGAKLALQSAAHGLLVPDQIKQVFNLADPGFVHETPPGLLSITQLTECGAVYNVEDIRALCAHAHDFGVPVHMDGARFANALVGLKTSPADMTWRAGVDVLTFGATKNGAIACEAIILFGEARAKYGELRARAKRAGHMPAKLRFTAAQMLGYLRDDLWLDLASQANSSARSLSELLLQNDGVTMAHPVDGNEVFARLPAEMAAKLTNAGVSFYTWLDGSHRFVCSWATRDSDIKAIEDILTV